jgi:hypothetical protein
MSDMTDRSRYRLSGMRIKHRVKVNWIKMYDKAGSVLRVEMVNIWPLAGVYWTAVWMPPIVIGAAAGALVSRAAGGTRPGR